MLRTCHVVTAADPVSPHPVLLEEPGWHSVCVLQHSRPTEHRSGMGPRMPHQPQVKAKWTMEPAEADAAAAPASGADEARFFLRCRRRILPQDVHQAAMSALGCCQASGLLRVTARSLSEQRLPLTLIAPNHKARQASEARHALFRLTRREVPLRPLNRSSVLRVLDAAGRRDARRRGRRADVGGFQGPGGGRSRHGIRRRGGDADGERRGRRALRLGDRRARGDAGAAAGRP